MDHYDYDDDADDDDDVDVDGYNIAGNIFGALGVLFVHLGLWLFDRVQDLLLHKRWYTNLDVWYWLLF